MEAEASFLSYYKTVLPRSFELVIAHWKTQVVVNLYIAVLSFLFARTRQADASQNLKFTVSANGIYLLVFAVFQLLRAPWKLDRERRAWLLPGSTESALAGRVNALNGMKASLDAERRANSSAELKGEFIRILFDLPYKGLSGPPRTRVHPGART